MKTFKKSLIALCTMLIGFSTFEGNCSNNNMNNSNFFSQNTYNMTNNIQNSLFFPQNNQNMNNSMYFQQNNNSITSVNSSPFAQNTYNMRSTIKDKQSTKYIEISVPEYSASRPTMLVIESEYERYHIFEILKKDTKFCNQNPSEYIASLMKSLGQFLKDIENRTMSPKRAEELFNYMFSAYDILVTENCNNPMMKLYWKIESKDDPFMENFKELENQYHKIYAKHETNIKNHFKYRKSFDNEELSSIWNELLDLIKKAEELLPKPKEKEEQHK